MKSNLKKEVKTAYLFVSPLLLVIFIFVFIPILGTCLNSFFQDIPFLPRKFVGIKNYIFLIKNQDFWVALRFTLLFTLVAVTLETVLGLSFALLLKEKFPGRGILRTILLIPWAIPTVVSARIWQLIYNYNYGLLNYILSSVGVSHKINWLGTSKSAFWALVIADVWKTTPFVAIILLAGLQAIPDEIYKQAKVDGARLMKRFLFITLPLLRPALMVALIFRTADSLRIFDLVYVLTGGGPAGATRTISILGFQYYTSADFGLGAAVSFITFLIVFIFSIFYIKLWGKRVYG
ncbi:MAG: sugar ABC transporter permease [Candidatus Desulfofervidaceae bacterium]|nr:sugar ABC transporter permease [Candidatus Desulfofervidaceae bacterium]